MHEEFNMKSTVFIISTVAFICMEFTWSLPTRGEHEEEEEARENNRAGESVTFDNVAALDQLKGLIEESRDAIIVHIDEKIGELKRDFLLTGDNEFLIAPDHLNEVAANEGEVATCDPRDEEPACGEFGECVPTDHGEIYTCHCEYGYTGDTCQLIDHCKDHPCENAAECVNNSDGLECDCADGWYGELCEIPVE